MMTAKAPWMAVTAIVISAMLSGCATSEFLGEETTMTLADTRPDGASGRDLTCGNKAVIQITHGGVDAGSLTVKVREGGGVPIWLEEISAGPEGSLEAELEGNPGRWQITLDRSLEFDTEFTLSFRC